MRGTYAVKLLSTEMQSNPEAVERFKLECSILANLDHPNITRCYEPGVEEGTPRRYPFRRTGSQLIRPHDGPWRDRAGAGIALSMSLNHMHKSHPRLARRITWVAICLNLAVTAQNFQQAR